MAGNKSMNGFDAVSLGIMWDRLISITDEIVAALVRTSFSLTVRCGDLSCVLFDGDGSQLAQGTYSVPSFTGTAGPTLRHMLRRFPPETLRPGDVIATNDPWMGTGHLYDISVMRPVFRGADLVGYTLSITHLPDIGGVGNSAVASEIYQEGLRLPVCKLINEGKLNTKLIELIRTNVRVEEQVIGDLMANITCNDVGNRQLLKFMEEYQIDDLAPLSQAIRQTSERRMRDKIEEIPDGSYENRIVIEGVDEPVTLACRIDKRGDSIAIDFAGTGAPVRHAINVPFCYTRAWSAYAIKCLTTPFTPNNEGSIRPIAFSAPEDCILNAQPPAPTAGRHSVGHFIVPLVFGALVDAVPEKVQADVGMMNIFHLYGRRWDGAGIATLFMTAGGCGALDGMDGASATPAPSNMFVMSNEAWENFSSMTVAKRALRPDSGGSGKYRGGAGQELVLVNDTGHPMTIDLMGQRTQFPAQGYRGGKPGQLRQCMLNDTRVPPKTRITLEPGDVLKLLEAGGGGFGDPRERSAAKVLQDVADGLVTAEGALRDYGMVVDLGRHAVTRSN
jgi:N-methylhydantoinase B